MQRLGVNLESACMYNTLGEFKKYRFLNLFGYQTWQASVVVTLCLMNSKKCGVLSKIFVVDTTLCGVLSFFCLGHSHRE